MSENNQAGNGVNDPLDIRNTNTASMQRMQMSSVQTPSSADTAKKTIKLKPLTQRPSQEGGAAPAGDFRSTATAPMKPFHKPAATPAPAAQPSQTAAKFMSTATGPLQQAQRPVGAVPIQPAQVGTPSQTAAKFMSTATGPLQQVQHPAGVTPVQPSQEGTPAPEAKPQSPVATVTQAIKRPVRSQPPAPAPASTAGAQTIKLTPQSVAAQKAAPAAASAGAQTIRLTPQAAASAEPVPAAPSGAQTIKLTPQAAPVETAPAEAPAPAGAQTIKLPANPAEAPAPAGAQTIKLPANPAEAPLQTPGAIPGGLSLKKNEEEPGKDPSAPSGLSLKKDPAPPPAAEPEEEKSALNVQDPSKNRKGKKIDISDDPISLTNESEDDEMEIKESKPSGSTGEPGIFFVATAIAALVLLGFVVYALAAQYYSSWENAKIPVVIFEQIHGSSGK